MSSPVFVGRTAQLDALRAALLRTGDGEAGAVFVSGESGVGKTRLMEEFGREVRAGNARFVVGGCVDVGGSELPYAPLLGALRALFVDANPAELEALVGPAVGELGRLLPELQGGGSMIEAVDPLAQTRLFEALLGLFLRAGRDVPVVLVIEDLHWADPSTRGFLSFLLRNTGRARLLLVATYRTDELHRRHPLRQFLAEVERLRVVERLELGPFTRRELAQQLAAILGSAPDHAVVEELFARSQGNAFFAEELLAASGESGRRRLPASLRDALTLRTERLSAQAQQLLRAAAAAGSVVGDRLLAEIAGLDDRERSEALREAIEHNVLVQESPTDTYSFRHELLREALYEELLPGERAALHAALARALEREPRLVVGEYGAAAQRAMHWAAAHEVARALAASVEAGLDAERVWSFAEANAHFERAVELWSGVAGEQRPQGLSVVDLLRRAAEAAYLSGQTQRAVTLTRSALRAVDPDRDPEAAGLAHERLGRYFLADMVLSDALAEYREAATLLPDEPTAARARILAGEAHILMLSGHAQRARAPCEEAVRIARGRGATDVECYALNTLGAVLGMLGALDDAIDALERGMQLAEELGALDELRRAYINLGQALDDAGRLEESAELGREGWERLRPLAPFLAAEAGSRFVRLGRWDEALSILQEAAEAAEPSSFAGLVLAELARLRALRGDLDRASLDLEGANQLLSEDFLYSPWLSHGPAAELAFARGRPEDVRQIVDPDAPIEVHPIICLPLFGLAIRAEADLAQRARASGDEAAERQAIAQAEALLARVETLVTPDTYPLSAMSDETRLGLEQCEREHSRARGETDPDAWAAQAARWEQLGRPYHAAYARLREAEAALTDRLPRARIVEALTSARSPAARLGAQPLLQQIAAVARAARVQGREAEREAVPGEVAELTARELDVLRLVAEGRTNPEIGTALYMSPKTASVHVSRILSKLDVKTRTEAAGVAHRLRLLDTPTPSTSPQTRSHRPAGGR